jgi:hypothetical protein
MNTASWRGFVLTLAIAAAAGFAGAKLGMAGLHPGGSQRVGEGSVRQSVDTLLDRDFKLNPAQKQQIEQIDESFTRTHNQIWADINTQNARLASAVATDMSLSPDAKTSIQGIQDGVGRLHTASIQYILQVRQVLTPAQRKDFDEHVIMALMRSPP